MAVTSVSPEHPSWRDLSEYFRLHLFDFLKKDPTIVGSRSAYPQPCPTCRRLADAVLLTSIAHGVDQRRFVVNHTKKVSLLKADF